MKRITYLQQSLRKGIISRWPDGVMPLNIYIGKYRWYKSSGDGEAYKYKQMVMDALSAWTSATGGMVSFNVVPTLYDSYINLDWKRVERKSLGNCQFHYDKNGCFYSAEVKIGLSDGIIHHKYMDEAEVYHTIVHEIGHSLGLGHSPYAGDIMYVPHQYGVTNVSRKDAMTLMWMYRFEVGASEAEILSKHQNTGAKDIDELIAILSGQKSDFQNTLESASMGPSKDLIQETQNIAELKKYLLEINKIKLGSNKPIIREDKNKPPQE